jgi:hypothetical protein
MPVNIKPEAIKKLEKIREYQLLIWGVLLGIFGNLFANLVDSIIKHDNYYPLWYWILLPILFLLIVFFLLRFLLKLKWWLFKSKRFIKKARRIQTPTQNPYKSS